MAQANLYTGVFDLVTPLPNKSWNSSRIDVSDRDGVNRTSGTKIDLLNVFVIACFVKFRSCHSNHVWNNILLNSFILYK